MDAPKKKKPEQVIFHYSGFPNDYKTSEILFLILQNLRSSDIQHSWRLL